MKKSKLALLLAGVLSLFVFAACSNSSGGGGSEESEKPSTSSQTKKITVTFEAGENAYYTNFGYRESTYTKTIEEGETVNEMVPEIYMSAADNYYYIYEYDHYCVSGTDTVFESRTIVQSC